MLSTSAVRVWSVDARSHFDAMSAYYAHMGWGAYKTDQDWDRMTYAEHGWE